MSYKYIVFLHTGYVGSDSYEFIEFDEEPLEHELNDICWMLALQNAESYGIYPECDREHYDEDEYSDNIEGYAVKYEAEKHDMYSMNGIPQFTKY